MIQSHDARRSVPRTVLLSDGNGRYPGFAAIGGNPHFDPLVGLATFFARIISLHDAFGRWQRKAPKARRGRWQATLETTTTCRRLRWRELRGDNCDWACARRYATRIVPSGSCTGNALSRSTGLFWSRSGGNCPMFGRRRCFLRSRLPFFPAMNGRTSRRAPSGKLRHPGIGSSARIDRPKITFPRDRSLGGRYCGSARSAASRSQ